jgi:hypothetical protein
MPAARGLLNRSVQQFCDAGQTAGFGPLDATLAGCWRISPGAGAPQHRSEPLWLRFVNRSAVAMLRCPNRSSGDRVNVSHHPAPTRQCI